MTQLFTYVSAVVVAVAAGTLAVACGTHYWTSSEYQSTVTGLSESYSWGLWQACAIIDSSSNCYTVSLSDCSYRDPIQPTQTVQMESCEHWRAIPAVVIVASVVTAITSVFMLYITYHQLRHLRPVGLILGCCSAALGLTGMALFVHYYDAHLSHDAPTTKPGVPPPKYSLSFVLCVVAWPLCLVASILFYTCSRNVYDEAVGMEGYALVSNQQADGTMMTSTTTGQYSPIPASPISRTSRAAAAALTGGPKSSSLGTSAGTGVRYMPLRSDADARGKGSPLLVGSVGATTAGGTPRGSGVAMGASGVGMNTPKTPIPRMVLPGRSPSFDERERVQNKRELDELLDPERRHQEQQHYKLLLDTKHEPS